MKPYTFNGFGKCGPILLSACSIIAAIGLSGCGGGATSGGLVHPTATQVPSPATPPPLALSTASMDALPDLSLDKIANSVQRVTEQHPTASQHDAAFGELLLEDLKKQQPDRHTSSYSLSQVTSAERRLLLTQPWNVLRTRDAVNQAASETVNRYPNGGMYQDRADAFRHTYWNILLCKKVSQSWAEQYTSAHESESSGIDRAMDMNNNAVGRRIFRENGFRSETDLSGYAYWFPSKRVSSEGEMNINYEVFLR